MNDLDTLGVPRPVRVVFPVQVAFAGSSFSIEEFTANLSVGGIFLPTERMVEPRTRGTLTFRISQWEEPFTIQAEVVRAVAPDGSTGSGPAGLGIQFIDLSSADRDRLERLVDGIRDGSVVQAIRRSIKDDGRNMLQELRRRPAGEKIIFAACANKQEIDALIRDGNPTVLLRLLDNPRLTATSMRLMLRDPRVPTKVFLALLRPTSQWLKNEELRHLFCTHPNAPLDAAVRLVVDLPRWRLVAIERDGNLRPAVRDKVRQELRAMVPAGVR